MDRSHTGNPKSPRRIEISEADGEVRESAAEETTDAECPFLSEGSDAAPGSPGEAATSEAQELAQEEEQAAEAEMTKLQEMLAELETKCAFAEDQHLRVVAELQNYKRRVQQEKQQLAQFATEGLVTELILVLDNFERAMEVPVDSAGAECLRAGVQMIYDQVQNVLTSHGVERIEAFGQDFDPHLHEAVEKEESTVLPPNVIVAELAKGYQLNGRLLRPARVRVTVRPADEHEA
jgi:molecular chaperone GrpE